MKRFLLAAALSVAPIVGASAQTKNFYGCGPLVCHSAVASVYSVEPQNYGSRTFSKAYSLNIQTTFQEPSFLPRWSIVHNMPIADLSIFNSIYDFVSWASPNFCFDETTGCVGTINYSFGGLVDDNYSFDFLYINAYLVNGEPFAEPNPTQQNIGVELRLVPEPSTYALFAAGLGALALLRRRRTT